MIHQDQSRAMNNPAVVSPAPTPPPDPQTLRCALGPRQEAAHTCGWYNADSCTVTAYSLHVLPLTLLLRGPDAVSRRNLCLRQCQATFRVLSTRLSISALCPHRYLHKLFYFRIILHYREWLFIIFLRRYDDMVTSLILSIHAR